MPEQKEVLKNLEESQKAVLQLQRNFEQIKAVFSDKVSKDVEKSALFNKIMAENMDMKAEIEIKDKELLDKDAELNILRTKLGPVLEENKNLARANASLMSEISVLKRDVDIKEKELHSKDSHFNMLMENIRNESQRKVKDAIDMDAKTIISLKDEVERLRAELEKKEALIKEREVKEKELMIDVVNRFKEMFSEIQQPGNGSLKELLPIMDSAIRKGESMDNIKAVLSKKGYSEGSIERAVVMLKKGV